MNNLICMHCIHWKKQTLVFLIHAHFAVTTVLCNVLSNHFFSKISWQNNIQQNDNICQIWLIISTTKMSGMLKHFRSRVSAEVEQLCLLAKLCVIPKPLHTYTQAWKQASGDPSGVCWNYHGITLLPVYKFWTPCYIMVL